MDLAFDLISDLHLDSNGNSDFDMTDKGTSPFCIVAGDVAKDRDLVIKTLRHLGTCYRGVFYIDGNDEHKHFMNNVPGSYRELKRSIEKIPNVHFLQDNVIVIAGIALLATNGWWGFDFNSDHDRDHAIQSWMEKSSCVDPDPEEICALARHDATYLSKSVQRLQRHRDVNKILIISHTVPNSDLVRHDLSINGSWKYNVLGNNMLSDSLRLDTEKKVHTWCFGHYHGSVDRMIDGVRYVNNCRGRNDGSSPYSYNYFPKRIVID